MKIFYIATTVHLGKNLDEGLGSTTHTYFIAKELTKLGHEVHVISKRYSDDAKFEIINGIQVHRLKRGVVASGKSLEKSPFKKYFKPFKAFLNIVLAYQIYKLVDQYGCDIILERNHSLGVGALTSYLTGRPLVLEVIDSILSKYSIKRAKHIIAYTDRFFRKTDQSKVKLVKVGFDPSTFYPEFMKTKYDICYAGSFKPWDGVEDLIVAINLLVNRYHLDKVKAVMVGSGEVFDQAMKLIKNYKLENNIIMAGRVEIAKVRKYINSSKLCVAPYNIKKSDRGEFDKYGFYYAPLKVVEYMACGMPIVATKYVMIKNILPQNGAKYFAEGDVDDLAINIKDVLKSDQILAMGESNLKESKKYTWQKVAADFDRVFNS